MCRRAKQSKMVGLCGSGGGMRKYMWYMVGTGTKFGEKWTENGAVDGDVAARGRMSGWKAGCPGAGFPGLTGRISGLDGPDVRALDPGTNGMNTAWRGQIRAKIRGICGWKLGVNGWEARSTQNKANPRIQTNKISTHQQITKKIGAIFGGEFSN